MKTQVIIPIIFETGFVQFDRCEQVFLIDNCEQGKFAAIDKKRTE